MDTYVVSLKVLLRNVSICTAHDKEFSADKIEINLETSATSRPFRTVLD